MILVARYFNTDLAEPEGKSRGEDIMVKIATAGMEDMSSQFLLSQKYWVWYGRMWCI